LTRRRIARWKAALAERAANSFEVVAREWFARFAPTWAPSHGEKILRRLERDVFPWMSGRPIRDITAQELLAVLRRMGYAKDEMTGHGFRAMARIILDEVLHVRPDFIEHQLAHANGRAYNWTAHLSERREMMQHWADYSMGCAQAL
jgi:integrase